MMEAQVRLLGQLTELLQRLEPGKNQTAALKPVQDALDEPGETLPLRVDRLRLHKAKGLLKPDAAPETERSGELLAAVRSKVQTDPLNLTAGQDFKQMLGELNKLGDLLASHTLTAWQRWFDEHLPRIEESDLRPEGRRYERRGG